jgi:glycosyltransferase involved in cell wall biosynthesis
LVDGGDKNKMKVVFVAFDFGEYCVRLASGIAENKDTRVLLLMPGEEASPYLHLLSASVERRIFDKPRIRQVFKQIRMVIGLVRQIRAFNPDVIHLQLGQFWFNLLALPLLSRFPLVLTVHDSQIHVGDAATGKTPQWVYDRACYQARERIVHAPQVKESLVKRLGIPADTVHVTPYAIVGEVDAAIAQGVYEEPLILFFGRIWPYKGLEYLIRAEPLITAKLSQTKIAIAGEGENFERYRRMMVNPEHFVIHNEFISDEKKTELFCRASVVVLPYIEASQSHIISIAYRFGKPVVATMVGGLPEMVDDGKTGFLVPPGDVDALAGAIVRLMQNDEMRRKFGQNGMRKVNEECAPEIVGRKTRVVYRKAISQSPPITDHLIQKQPSSQSSSETFV